MNRDTLFLAVRAAWIVLAALSWLYAVKGYSSWPKADMWLWGSLFCLNALVAILYAAALVLDQQS